MKRYTLLFGSALFFTQSMSPLLANASDHTLEIFNQSRSSSAQALYDALTGISARDGTKTLLLDPASQMTLTCNQNIGICSVAHTDFIPQGEEYSDMLRLELKGVAASTLRSHLLRPYFSLGYIGPYEEDIVDCSSSKTEPTCSVYTSYCDKPGC